MKQLTITIFLLISTILKISAVDSKIFFAGRVWIVKDKGTGTAGPGGNHWSPNNVWVDENGYLHMKITNVDGKWYCAEVYAVEHISYREHKYYISGRPDLIDPSKNKYPLTIEINA